MLNTSHGLFFGTTSTGSDLINIWGILFRPVRAIQAAVKCIKRAIHNHQPKIARPLVVVVSDTPSLISDIRPLLAEFAEVG